jgi:hypothetical protein
MILFCYGGDPKHFDAVFHLEGTSLGGGMTVYRPAGTSAGLSPYAMYRIFYMFGSAFVCFFVLPMLVVVIILKESPRNYGLRFPTNYSLVRLAVFCQVLIAALLYFIYSHHSDQRAIFPYSKYLVQSHSVTVFAFYSTCYFFITSAGNFSFGASSSLEQRPQ